jgi:hypothetical protein
MRMVVDSNCLCSEALRTYLAAPPRRTWLSSPTEMAKAKNLEALLKSTEVLSQYPRQVMLAKEITTASSLRGRKKRFKKRLTDGKRTRALRKWCRIRDDIKRGDKRFDHRQSGGAGCACGVEASTWLWNGASSVFRSAVVRAYGAGRRSGAEQQAVQSHRGGGSKVLAHAALLEPSFRTKV